MPLYHHKFSSPLQLSTHIHPRYDHIIDRTRRISNLPTSLTSIPHQALLDRHCTHISWKFGMPLETLQETTQQNPAIPQILRTTPISSTQLITTLQLELSNIQDIYKSSETTVISTVNLLNSNQPQSIT